VRLTVYVPRAEYAWVGEEPVPVAPSPKLHEYTNGSPSASLDPVPSNWTA